MALSHFPERAKGNRVLVVNELKAADEKVIEHGIPKPTFYGVPARYGWRKLDPQSRHRKGDPQKAETLKRCLNGKAGAEGRIKEVRQLRLMLQAKGRIRCIDVPCRC